MEDSGLSKENEETSGKKSLSASNKLPLILVLSIFVSSLFLAFLIFFQKALVSNKNKANPQNQNTPKEKQDTTSVLSVGPNAVILSSIPEGNKVDIDVVLLEKPGYALVHDNDDGKPGKILGQSELFPQGENKTISVNLDRAGKTGETLYIGLYLDDGDGKFDPLKDQLAKDGFGNTVVAQVTVTKSVDSEGNLEISY